METCTEVSVLKRASGAKKPPPLIGVLSSSRIKPFPRAVNRKNTVVVPECGVSVKRKKSVKHRYVVSAPGCKVSPEVLRKTPMMPREDNGCQEDSKAVKLTNTAVNKNKHTAPKQEKDTTKYKEAGNIT